MEKPAEVQHRVGEEAVEANVYCALTGVCGLFVQKKEVAGVFELALRSHMSGADLCVCFLFVCSAVSRVCSPTEISSWMKRMDVLYISFQSSHPDPFLLVATCLHCGDAAPLTSWVRSVLNLPVKIISSHFLKLSSTFTSFVMERSQLIYRAFRIPLSSLSIRTSITSISTLMTSPSFRSHFAQVFSPTAEYGREIGKYQCGDCL